MSERQSQIVEWFCILLGIVIIIVSIAGCARNSLYVFEKTADGGIFEIRQTTTSTLGSRTETGTGSVMYTGSSDPDEFQLSAGAAVEGQQSQDPAASFRAVLEFMQSITAP